MPRSRMSEFGLAVDCGRQFLRRTELLDLIGQENVFLGPRQHGASLRQALAAAEEWLAQDRENRG